MTRDHTLLAFMLVYGAASLVHFVHNAVYLELYPNMPAWLTPVGVLASWLVIAATGATYAIAPVSAHTLIMNATIVGEVIAATALLVVIAWAAVRVRVIA